MDDKKSALVLSGGGAYAAYEIGVMKALFSGQCAVTNNEPLRLQIISGTSAGAFNAALLLSLEGDGTAAVTQMEHIWIGRIAEGPETCGSNVFRFRGNPFEFFDPGCVRQNLFLPLAYAAGDASYFAQDWFRRSTNFLVSSVELEQRALELVDLGSLISTTPFDLLVEETIQPQPIRDSKITLRIAVTNWRTGQIRVFGNKDMSAEDAAPIVRASSSIPGVFPSVEIEGEPYVDGGVVMNTPLKPAIDAGADILHAIYMDPNVQSIALPKIRNTVSTAYRLMIIGFGSTMNRDIEIAERINRTVLAGETHRTAGTPAYRKLTIHRYHPREDLGGVFRWLSFGRDHLIKLINLGAEDAIAHNCAANRCVLP
jgi:NTE family protein